MLSRAKKLGRQRSGWFFKEGWQNAVQEKEFKVDIIVLKKLCHNDALGHALC
jgi:hypothetical protein